MLELIEDFTGIVPPRMRTQASPAHSADGGKVESDEVRRLREALQALGHGLDDYWVTTEEGKAALKLRDAALSAQQGEGERG